MRMRPHHLGIIVKDMMKTAKFYSEFLGFEQITDVFDANDPRKANYGCKWIFMRAKGTPWLIELLEPTSGDWMKRLEEKGDGAMLEFCFCVDDIAQYYDDMLAKGITLNDSVGKPVPPDQKFVLSVPTGNKFLYFPEDISKGTWIEILEESGTQYIPEESYKK